MLRFSAMLLMAAGLVHAQPIHALIIDGQNNHDWKATTPVLKRQLEETGRFRVDVITTPPKGSDLSAFRPDFSGYRRRCLELQRGSMAGGG